MYVAIRSYSIPINMIKFCSWRKLSCDRSCSCWPSASNFFCLSSSYSWLPTIQDVLLWRLTWQFHWLWAACSCASLYMYWDTWCRVMATQFAARDWRGLNSGSLQAYHSPVMLVSIQSHVIMGRRFSHVSCAIFAPCWSCFNRQYSLF